MIAQNYTIPESLGISSECRELLKSMLLPKPASRITLEEILANPWFKCVGPPLPTLTPPVAALRLRLSRFRPPNPRPLCALFTTSPQNMPRMPRTALPRGETALFLVQTSHDASRGAQAQLASCVQM